jgi:hypothetical protein
MKALKRVPATAQKGKSMSNFYIVQRNGIPAIWQVDPKGIVALLKRKSKLGYFIISDVPTSSRAEALTRLRELFPGARPANQQRAV